MAVTTYKGAYLPTVSGDSGTWGTKLNTDTFPVFDKNIGGIVSKSLSSSNVVLSAAESQNAILRLTGTLSASVQVTTSCQGYHFVENLCTLGGYTVTVTDGVSGVTVPYGRYAVIFDSTNGARLLTSEAASQTSSGLIEIATDAEVQTGTDTDRAVTPAGLQACTGTVTRAGVLELATTSEASTGTDTARAVTPKGIATYHTDHIASQANMESASSTTLYVTPGRMNYHPGVIKAWGEFDGTGTATLNTNHGISSLTDNGTGVFTLAFDTAFSSVNYGFNGNVGFSTGSSASTVAAYSSGTKLTTSFKLKTSNTDYGSSSLTDFDTNSFIFYGDQ